MFLGSKVDGREKFLVVVTSIHPLVESFPHYNTHKTHRKKKQKPKKNQNSNAVDEKISLPQNKKPPPDVFKPDVERPPDGARARFV